MAKFDGLVWKKGAPGWDEIPAGIGGVMGAFDVQTDDAALRVEGEVKAGYGGKKVDFRNVNDLLKVCTADTTGVTPGNPPRVIYGAVHPTNLKAAIIVWSVPVVLIDASKIAGGSAVALNGRVMTVQVSAVKIDGTDSQSINIQAGAVGAYGKLPDPNEPAVADTTDGVYAGTQNDTSVGDDQKSQTEGEEIPLFVPNDTETVSVSVSLTYKMEDAKQTCGEPHKIWGACFCIWGSTIPMGTFPFGQTMDVDPGNLAPTSTFYGGTVSATAYVDRGAEFDIAVAGVAGPVVKVASVNGKLVPLQPGQAVSFRNYLCDTVCGKAKKTLLHDVDEALAYVDEDIIKPSERTLPVYTFIETTYYMTTMNGMKTTEIPALTTTDLKTKLFTKLWQDVQVLDTAILWEPLLSLSKHTPGVPFKLFEVGGVPDVGLIKLPMGSRSVITPAGTAPVAPVTVALYPTAGHPVWVPAPGVPFMHTPVYTPCSLPRAGTYTVLDVKYKVIDNFTSKTIPVFPAASKAFVNYSKASVPTVFSSSTVDVLTFPAGTKAVTPPIGKGAIPGAPVTIRNPVLGSQTVTGLPQGIAVTRKPISLNGAPSGSFVMTGAPDSVILTTEDLVVCGPGGSQTTLKVLTYSGASLSVVTGIPTAAVVPFSDTLLTAVADFVALTSVTLAATVDVPLVQYDTTFQVVTDVTLADPTLKVIPDLTTGLSIDVVTAIITSDVTFESFATILPSPVLMLASEVNLAALDPGQLVTASVSEMATVFMPKLSASSVFDVGSIPVATNISQLSLVQRNISTDGGYWSPSPLDITKYKDLIDLTAFDPNGTALTLMKPIPNSTLTLPILDTNVKIPILDTQGPPEKAVALLIQSTDGDLKLVGMTDPLSVEVTSRFARGVCTPGSISVSSSPGADYEKDGEIKLLAPIPVTKGKGNAEDCPCFTGSDPDGGPSAPSDNSAIGANNPCTLRVRRLQLRQCHI